MIVRLGKKVLSGFFPYIFVEKMDSKNTNKEKYLFKRQSAAEKQPQDIRKLHKYNNILVIYLLISNTHMLEIDFNRSYKINNKIQKFTFLQFFFQQLMY